MKKQKDVLFLCQFFYPDYISSATLPLDTALALKKSGFLVDVICGYPKEYSLISKVPIKETYMGININRLKYIQIKRSNVLGRLINYFSFTIAVSLKFLKFRKYKAIIVYSNPPILPFIAGIANKFFKTKVIFVSYDVYPEIAYVTKTIGKDSIISKLMQTVNKSIFKNVTKVVALSHDMKKFLLNNRQISENKIEVIPNWYEDKKIIKVSRKNTLFNSIKNEKNIVVSYFGNVGLAQDIETIISAMRILKTDERVHFLFAGHGNKMSELKEIVNNEKIKNVTIFDFLHGQDYEAALDVSDCFLVSLASEVTGLAVPSKTYSYMMSGKPVLAIMGAEADISKELVENNAGYSIEVGENEKLVNAIIELRDNKEKLLQMGNNCRKVFLEKYTTEHCTKQYVDMMQDILEDNKYVQ